jgi:hypothetical protein
VTEIPLLHFCNLCNRYIHCNGCNGRACVTNILLLHVCNPYMYCRGCKGPAQAIDIPPLHFCNPHMYAAMAAKVPPG